LELNMAAQQTGTKPGVSPEDEDLFDFPVVEMQLESEPEPKAAIPSAAAAQASASGAAASAELMSSAADEQLVPAAKSSSPKAPVTAGESTPAQPATFTPAVAAPPRLFKGAWIAIAVLAAINIAGLLFVWNASRAVKESVDRLEAMAATQAAELEPTTTVVTETQPAPVRLTPPESFDVAALRLAREELRTGNPAAARKRLSQLMAVIDRVDPQSRPGVEAEALYLSAQALETALNQRQANKP
jgi:hypothetical protein